MYGKIPTSGYSDSISFRIPNKLTPYERREGWSQKQFYIKHKDGEMYSIVSLDMALLSPFDKEFHDSLTEDEGLYPDGYAGREYDLHSINTIAIWARIEMTYSDSLLPKEAGSYTERYEIMDNPVIENESCDSFLNKKESGYAGSRPALPNMSYFKLRDEYQASHAQGLKSKIERYHQVKNASIKGTRIWAKRFDGAQWVAAEAIDTAEGIGNAQHPEISFDRSGNALAVWHQGDGGPVWRGVNGQTDIWANRFDGSTWGTAERVEKIDSGDASYPRIVVNDSGKAIAMWLQGNGGKESTYANHFDGRKWGSAERMQNLDSQQSKSSVVFDYSDHAIAAWSQTGKTGVSLYIRQFDGSDWDSAEEIETDYHVGVPSPKVTVGKSGNAFVAVGWSNIYVSRFDGSDWGAVELIESGATRNFQLAADDSGNAMVLWSRNGKLYSNRFEGSGWGNVELVATGIGNGNPKIEFDDRGNAIAMWAGWGDSEPSIYAAQYDGESWGPVEHVVTGGIQGRPEVTFDDSGSAIAVWRSESNVYATRFDGSNWSTVELIKTGESNSSLLPKIAVDDSGNAIVVWAE